MNTTLARAGAATGALAGAVVLLTACSSSGNAPAAPVPSTSPSGSSSTSPGTGPGGRFGPAASGKIAAINGKTVQVQNQQSGQVAVKYTGKTTFSQTVSTTLKKIKQGDCVTAVAPSGTSTSATSFTAARITVTRPVNGSCTGGFGGQRPTGAQPSGAPSGFSFPSGARSRFPFPGGNRSGFPSGFPSGGRFPGGANFGAVASGKVSSVSGSKLVVAARQFNSTSSKSISVSVGSSTTITTMAAATAKALHVGKCLTAQGSTDSSGAVQATRIQVNPATNGQCTIGFGGFGGR
jgi:hypothetical protein